MDLGLGLLDSGLCVCIPFTAVRNSQSLVLVPFTCASRSPSPLQLNMFQIEAQMHWRVTSQASVFGDVEHVMDAIGRANNSFMVSVRA